ncbi:MAG TPA: hypothetical protein DHV68_05650 [Dehalococcoidia bacterium]|nr:hypothetical protein [Chloroflexota bacterium]HCI86311.1 hypothetical protein [Dehalococcoidia bacterium]|tara:strand:- start:1146 stop:1610 length:465 start_codon:yes stop_codon:yes gene_type:complete
MPTFTPGHLGKWESLYNDLMDGERSALTQEGTWMLGDKPGLVCVFEEDEPLFIEASSNISKTLQCYIKAGSDCEFRTMLGIVEMGASVKNAAQRAKSGPLALRISKRVEKFRYRVAPASAKTMQQLADAFNVVADTRYAGPSALANRALDALPG